MVTSKEKTRNIFWTIIALVFLSIIINLPKSIHIKFKFFNQNINHTFYKPDFNFSAGNFTFKKNFDLKYGLDLAGGASLIFKINPDKVKKEDLPSALESLKTNIERRTNYFGVSEANIQISNQYGQYRLLIELPGIENVNEAIKLIGQTARLSFKGESDNPSKKEATSSADLQELFSVDTGLNGSHLVRSSVNFNSNNGEPEVALEFNETGAKLFETATKKFLNKRIAVFLDETPLTVPTVKTVIPDGRAVINGSFDTKTAKSLSAQLNAGALPLPIELISQNQIGATLGKDTIDKGIKAGIIGLVAVFIFMIGNYGWLGVIANVCLIIFALFTLTIYRLIPIALTFPGMVGFILSVGMAVDSNILIFERLKEESRAGKPWNVAMELGFGRAWDSIKDANATTIIIGLILFNPFNWSFLNTSGLIRGFAVTLILGIIISIFTGVFVTRNILRVFAKEKKI